MNRTSAVLLLVVLGCRSGDDHAAIAPVNRTSPAVASRPNAAEIAAREVAFRAELAEATVKVGKSDRPPPPFIPPQSTWAARIRNGGPPIVVAKAGNIFVVPFFQTSPGVWAYVVQENGVFSLPIIGNTLPVSSEAPTLLPDGREVTTSAVRLISTTRQVALVATIPWELPDLGDTVEADLDTLMATEIKALGLTVVKATHGPVGGAPGLLVKARGKYAGAECEARLWKIYLPKFKRVLSYSLFSPDPVALRISTVMMNELFKVGDS